MSSSLLLEVPVCLLSPLPLLWPHFPFLHNYVRTTVSSCHSSSPSFPPEKLKTFWEACRLSDDAAAAVWEPGRLQLLTMLSAMYNSKNHKPASLWFLHTSVLYTSANMWIILQTASRIAAKSLVPVITFLFSSSPRLSVMDLIYWKDTERTGMVLTGLVVGMLSLFQLSIITVVSTVSLAVMCFTISVRIYYQVLYILSWGDGQHPFK